MTKNHWLLAAVIALLGAACGKKDRAPDLIRFVDPEPEAVLTGVAQVHLESEIDEPVDQLSLRMDGKEFVSLDHLAFSLVVDTTAFDNGRRELTLEAVTASGKRYSDAVEVDIDNPAHRLMGVIQDQRAYGRGDEIVLDLEYSEEGLDLEADFSELDSEFVPGSVQSEELGAGRYRLSYTISENSTSDPRVYSVPVVSTGAEGPGLESPVPIHFLGAPKMPLVVKAPGAVFTDAAPEIIERPSGAPKVEAFEVPETLIEGVPATMSVTWSAPEENPADRIVIRCGGSSGAWVIPLPLPSTGGSLEFPVDLSSSATRPESADLPVALVVLGKDGTTLSADERYIRATVMPLVGVKVLLQWQGAADLDLSVTTPDTTRISYSSREGQGGELELDANGMCGGRGMPPTESISWAPGAEIPGEYGVTVTQYEPCGDQSVDYLVTILACGRSQQIRGSFSASDTGAAAVHELPSFVVDCVQDLRVVGRVLHQRWAAVSLRDGEPAVNVPIRILGTAEPKAPSAITDDEGRFDLRFRAVEGAELSLAVDSSWTVQGASEPRARVVPLTGDQVHTASVGINPESCKGQKTDFVIPHDTRAGAFNILDVLRRSFIWVDTHFDVATAQKVTPLPARWERGKHIPSPDQTYYAHATNGESTIWIRGHESDRDEFDDGVVAHEFVHHIAASLKVDDSPGNRHFFNKRYDPRLAWSEGLAFAIGQTVLNDPGYFNRVNRFAGEFLELETTQADASQGMAYGTDPAGSMSGKVNEVLVAAVIWDLLDPDNEYPFDAIDGAHYSARATYSTLSRYLNPSHWKNRGARGRDLVDFLDGWRCYMKVETDRAGEPSEDTALKDLLGYRKFPYERPETEPECP